MQHTDIDDLAAMVESYLRTALFTRADENASAPYAATAEGIDIADMFDLRSIVVATDDCRSFCELVDDIPFTSTTAALGALCHMAPAEAGANFWLTRQRHGAGFWDRGLGDAGRVLTDIAHSFGDGGLHVADGKATLA